MSIWRHTRRKDEKGAEAVAMIFVIPVMIVLVLGLIDVGMMFRARMLVENIARDTVRGAAADGGNFNNRTNTIGMQWEDWGFNRLYRNNKCRIGNCVSGEVPELTCVNATAAGAQYAGNVVRKAGDTITCRVSYPYKPINGELLNSPLGLGIGSLLKEFDISVSARAETGDCSVFSVDNAC